ncbi:MAG: hypothetical protein ACP5F1_04475 [Thermoplasmata archaeon]|nr:hypothetical protein [Thermoplasmata archaeon]
MKESQFALNILLGFLLLGLLWWLPIFGPMISGYVVGKRSESAKMGALISAIPAITIFLIVFSVKQGYLYIPHLYLKAPWDFSGLVVFIFNSVNTFTLILNNYIYFIHYAPPYFVIMIIFGIIGGSLAKKEPEQKKFRKNVENKLKHEYVQVPKQSPLIKRAIKEKKHSSKEIDDEIPEYM